MNEPITYSWQLLTVVLAHISTTTRFLHRRFDLKYNEFALLMHMAETDRAIDVDDAVRFLMLKRQTAWELLLRMEENGVLVKLCDENDGRKMLCFLTDKGAELARNSIKQFNDEMRSLFLESLPSSEMEPLKMHETMARLRGEQAQSPTPQTPTKGQPFSYCADYLIFWRVLNERWSAHARAAHLALAEYRILEILNEYDYMNPGGIAKCLIMQKSGVSLYCRSLAARQLISMADDPFDKRGTIIRPTKLGTVAYLAARQPIISTTRECHGAASQHDIIVLNAWYMRMYANVRDALNS